MKDMPSYLPEGLKFASIPKREDAKRCTCTKGRILLV